MSELNIGGSVDGLVQWVAAEAFGATKHEDPIEGYRLLTRTRLDPVIDGVRAAARVRNAAQGLIYDYAMKARAAGFSWEQIGRALFEGDDWADQPVGEIAYEVLIWRQAPPQIYDACQVRESSAHWTCPSCGRTVVDRGPWEANPENTEEGHTEDCERHRSDVLAYREEWDDD